MERVGAPPPFGRNSPGFGQPPVGSAPEAGLVPLNTLYLVSKSEEDSVGGDFLQDDRTEWLRSMGYSHGKPDRS
jgi:hypothetical protein